MRFFYTFLLPQRTKFYTPWRGIYNVTQKTSKGTYLVKKKGQGKARKAHVNRLKFYHPKNSHEDPAVHISAEDDEEDAEEPITKIPFVPNPNQRITRSKTRNLPPPITRYQPI